MILFQRLRHIFFGLFLASISYSTIAEETLAQQFQAEHSDRDNWGLAIGYRHADIPFATEEDKVDDIIPLIYYRNEYLFIKGLEAGVHIWKNKQHQVNLYSRFRFVDIPKEYQNETQSDAFDLGIQYRFQHDQWDADIALLSDGNKRSYAYTRIQYQWQNKDLNIIPYTEFKWKSHDFNNHYYGLDIRQPGSGISFGAGVKGRYHVASNLYLIGNVGITRLENNLYNLDVIDGRYQMESFLGFGFYPDTNNQNRHNAAKETGEYIRIAHGWATPSNLNAILSGNTEKDPYNNQLTSLFYGVPLADSLFTLPIDLYFTVGGAWHHDSEVQNNLAETVLAIKAYYTFEFGPRWRLGVAEGLSYVSNITHIEGSELEEKEYRPSKLLNYLDFSLDVNIGDIFNQHKMRNMWLGYSIHHRSGIFETSSAFGRIKGGSNYNSVYLQWHF